MNYIELKKVVKELLKIMKKYHKDNSNTQIIMGFLLEMLYLIDRREIVLEVESKLKEKLKSLYPPHEGLSDYYIYLDDKDKMIEINKKLEELKDKLWFLVREE